MEGPWTQETSRFVAGIMDGIEGGGRQHEGTDLNAVSRSDNNSAVDASIDFRQSLLGATAEDLDLWLSSLPERAVQELRRAPNPTQLRLSQFGPTQSGRPTRAATPESHERMHSDADTTAGNILLNMGGKAARELKSSPVILPREDQGELTYVEYQEETSEEEEVEVTRRRGGAIYYHVHNPNARTVRSENVDGQSLVGPRPAAYEYLPGLAGTTASRYRGPLEPGQVLDLLRQPLSTTARESLTGTASGYMIYFHFRGMGQQHGGMPRDEAGKPSRMGPTAAQGQHGTGREASTQHAPT
ncbi:hypothetical protein OC861_006241 [Tilletia horrida]|nr:hypothetical protein OC861_006241 [Tilletia horrida]